jgi:hypothetical protein
MCYVCTHYFRDSVIKTKKIYKETSWLQKKKIENGKRFFERQPGQHGEHVNEQFLGCLLSHKTK